MRQCLKEDNYEICILFPPLSTLVHQVWPESRLVSHSLDPVVETWLKYFVMLKMSTQNFLPLSSLLMFTLRKALTIYRLVTAESLKTGSQSGNSLTTAFQCLPKVQNIFCQKLGWSWCNLFASRLEVLTLSRALNPWVCSTFGNDLSSLCLCLRMTSGLPGGPSHLSPPHPSQPRCPWGTSTPDIDHTATYFEPAIKSGSIN